MKNTSSNELKESLSAVMDGEANELELCRVLNQLEEDADFRETAKQYQATNSIAQGLNPDILKIDISDAIRKKIQMTDNAVIKPVHPQKTRSKKITHLFQSLSKMAVAASVTIAVIIGVRSWQDSVYFDNFQTKKQHVTNTGGGLILTSNEDEVDHPHPNLPESHNMHVKKNTQEKIQTTNATKKEDTEDTVDITLSNNQDLATSEKKENNER
ncbi:MAG: hypothetical protein HAW62_03065 [Endozoicomonadaceae bacterium]|nr:hypothetical protein [Endozoicomonadaceae bacterium]